MGIRLPVELTVHDGESLLHKVTFAATGEEVASLIRLMNATFCFHPPSLRINVRDVPNACAQHIAVAPPAQHGM